MSNLALVRTLPDESGPSVPAPKSREELVALAREIGEFAWEHREEAERARRMPDKVVEKLRESGLMKLARHRKWGGAEADPMTFLDVGRELARGYGSLGWIFSVLGFHDWYMALTSDEMQHDVWAHEPDAMVANSFAPTGMAEPVADGFLLTGRWRFCSGIEWASWIGLATLKISPDGDRPEMTLFFVPKKDVTVHDDWFTLGLRGTASRTVAAEQVFVPKHRTFPLVASGYERGAVVNDGPIWRMPTMTMQGLAILTPSVGIAQRMVDEAHAWTSGRVRPLHGMVAQEMPASQLTYASAATRWDALWTLAQRYAQFGWDRAHRGESFVLTDEERAQLFSWRGFIGRTAIEICDELFAGAGAMAVFDTHPMQQIFRDIHAAGVHVGVDRADAYTSRGRVAFGFPGNPVH